jgi:hypothetical protein
MWACVQRGRSHRKKPSKFIQRRYPYLLRHLQRLLFILEYITSVVLHNFSYYLPPILLPDGNFPCGARILPDSLKSKHDNYQLSRFTDRIVYLIRTKQDNFDDPSSWEWNMDDLILKAASCQFDMHPASQLRWSQFMGVEHGRSHLEGGIVLWHCYWMTEFAQRRAYGEWKCRTLKLECLDFFCFTCRHIDPGLPHLPRLLITDLSPPFPPSAHFLH